MNFNSDNVYGCHPRILEAMAAANAGTEPSYGSDSLTRRAQERLQALFECPLDVFLVTTGTAANGLALSALAPGYGAVLCHQEAHVAVDECNAPEFFTGGAKILGLPGNGGKITPLAVESVLAGFIRGEHDPKPMALSIADVTELGTLYRPDEIRALSAAAKPRGISLHMDGARFANALVSLGVTPAELTWKSGIDALSFGATKNGAMLLEAVIFFDRRLAQDFAYRRMRAGQLVSKSRFLGAQMLAYLDNDLWLENARRANGLAQRLATVMTTSSEVRLAAPVEANEVFAILPLATAARLRQAGATFHEWVSSSVPALGPAEGLYRFVLSWATPESAVDGLARALAT